MNTPTDPLRRVLIHGFKSIESCNLELKRLNVIIGANGSGKSNFLGVFRMMQAAVDGKLNYFVPKHGGPDAILRYGRSVTKRLSVRFNWEHSTYLGVWEATADNRLMFVDEECDRGIESNLSAHIGRDRQYESILAPNAGLHPEDDFEDIAIVMAQRIRGWRTYHFHDTSETATVKRIGNIDDHAYFRPDGENLAAFLWRLRAQHPASYDRIVKMVRQVAPFFGDFVLEPETLNQSTIQLRWREQGRDEPFRAFQLSDGTLRFICLATLFHQPDELRPSIILIDEPELGLHPLAIEILGGMIRSASVTRQVIVTTQSVELLNCFAADDIIVVDRPRQGSSMIHRLDAEKLKEWLDEYSLGQLWQANHLGGRPA